MIRLFFILITLFAVERVVSKRINTYKIKKVKTLIHQINNQYKYLFKGKSEYINFYQWLILFISQAFVVYALVRYIVKKIFRYVEENYILFGKTLTIIFLILFLYFVIGYLFHNKYVYDNFNNISRRICEKLQNRLGGSDLELLFKFKSIT